MPKKPLSSRIEELAENMPPKERTLFLSMASRRAKTLKAQGLSDNAILASFGDTQAAKKEKSVLYRILKSRWTIASSAMAICIITLGGFFAWSMVKESITPGSVDALGINSTTKPPSKESEASEYGETENILFVGTDFRDGKNKFGEGTSEQVEGKRTDALMLIMIPKDRSRVSAISFPRDSDVVMQNCHSYNYDDKKYGGLMPTQSGVKINSLYDHGGPACLVSTISDLTGVQVDSYIEADFSAFVEAVNAVGGVEVCSPNPLVDDELGVILPRAGKHNLKGKDALQYVRARKVEGTSKTDYDRIRRQQQVVMSVFRKAKSNGVLSSPSRLLELAGVVSRNLKIDGIGIDGLVDLANSLRNLPEARFVVQTAPITGDETPTGNVILDTTKLRSLAELASDSKSSDGSYTNASTIGRKQSDITLRVNNTNSAAVKSFAKKLKAAGFGAVDIVKSNDPAPQNSYVAWDKGNGNASITVMQAVPDLVVYRSSDSSSIGTTIVVGKDVSSLKVNSEQRVGVEGRLPNSSSHKLNYNEVFRTIKVDSSNKNALSATNAKIDACS